jgi:hypothetical protein
MNEETKAVFIPWAEAGSLQFGGASLNGPNNDLLYLLNVQPYGQKVVEDMARADRKWLSRLTTRYEKPENFNPERRPGTEKGVRV